jgi:phenylacetate-CoA ligase
MTAWLPELVSHAYAHAPAIRRAFDTAAVDPASIHSVQDLARVPITRKDTLIELQRADPPFGGFLGVPEGQLARVFMSPGPLFDPQGPQPDYWRFAGALQAAGFRANDIVLNACSHHFTPLGFMFDEAARALGCRVIPSGVGNTELQVTAAKELKASAYCGTPSFLKIIIDKAVEMGLEPQSDLALRCAFVAAEMLPESLRAAIEAMGVSVRQGYGTADLGCLGYECSELAGMHVPDGVILEIVDPSTGQPLRAGEAGEIVATVNNPVYPVLRFGTGDLSALEEAPCGCGRTSPRLVRIMGRIGDAVKVRGMFVHPRQLEHVLARFPDIQHHQVVVDRVADRDVLLLRLEVADGVSNLTDRVADAVREVLHVRPDIEIVEAGVIGEDVGKIVDRRTWT